MNARRVRRLLPAVVIALGLLATATAQACTIDGKPSVSANGILALRNESRASPGNLGHWAVFVFGTSFAVGQKVQFAENTPLLRSALPSQAWGKPWRWTLGDGTTLTGYSVRHVYAHAGSYKLTISAYYSGYGQWLEFDDALVTIRSTAASR